MFKAKMKKLLIATLSVLLVSSSAVGVTAFAEESGSATEAKELAPMAWYNFSDTANLGKDAMGNYNLTLTTRNGGNITAAEGGGVQFDGNSILFSKNSDGGLGNVLEGKNYTLIAKFRPDSDNPNSGIVGFGRNDWGEQGTGFKTYGGGTHLRFSADGKLTSNFDWCSDVGDMSTTEDTVAVISIEMGGTGHVYMNGVEKVTFNIGTDWVNCGTGGRFCIGGEYRNMWVNENTTFTVGDVRCFKGIVHDVKIYDELLSATEIVSVVEDGKALDEKLAKASSVEALDYTEKVSVSEDDEDQAVLSVANGTVANRLVTVTMSDDSQRKGLVTFDTVVTEEGKTYIEAPVNFVYNPNGVKVRAEISVAHYEVINPVAKYEFTDATNPGKDSMGNFDLVKYGNGTITVKDGAVTFDGKAALAPVGNYADISEYLSSFTLLFEINKTTATNEYWATPIGFGAAGNTATCEQWNTFHFAGDSPRLRYTLSSKLADGVSDIDGHGDMYWGHDIADVNVGSYDKVALSIEAGGKLNVYFNGTLISEKVFDVPAGYNMANELLRFAMGGIVTSNGMSNGFVGSLKNVAVYDFAMTAQQVSAAQNGGVVKTNTLTDESVTVKSISDTVTFVDDEVLSATAYDKMSDEEILSLLNVSTAKITLSNRQAKNAKVAFNKIVKENGVYYAVGKIAAGAGVPSTVEPVTVKQEIEVVASNKVTVVSAKNGTLTCDTAYFAAGASKTLNITATPKDGYAVKYVKVNGTEIKAVDGVYTYTATEDTEITAEFAKLYTVTKKAAENGSFTVSAESVMEGETVEVVATPAAGYKVATVKVNGEAIFAVNGKYTFAITENSEVEVTFAELAKFNVTASECENGEITLSASGEVVENTVIEITVTPAEGYKVASVKVNGEEITAVNGKYTFTVTDDSTVEATFAVDEKPAPADDNSCNSSVDFSSIVHSRAALAFAVTGIRKKRA